jgi:hypothetical protein
MFVLSLSFIPSFLFPFSLSSLPLFHPIYVYFFVGTFLVRFSASKRSEYVISFISDEKALEHIRVQHNLQKGSKIHFISLSFFLSFSFHSFSLSFSLSLPIDLFYLDSERTFASISDLLKDISLLKKYHVTAKTACKGSDFEKLRALSKSRLVVHNYLYTTEMLEMRKKMAKAAERK